MGEKRESSQRKTLLTILMLLSYYKSDFQHKLNRPCSCGFDSQGMIESVSAVYFRFVRNKYNHLNKKMCRLKVN